MNDLESAFEHRGVKLVKTSEISPEQYDAYDGRGRKVGYLRLRHGVFTVETPTCGGEIVLVANPIGQGCFVDDERDDYLTQAVDAIKTFIKHFDA